MLEQLHVDDKIQTCTTCYRACCGSFLWLTAIRKRGMFSDWFSQIRNGWSHGCQNIHRSVIICICHKLWMLFSLRFFHCLFFLLAKRLVMVGSKTGILCRAVPEWNLPYLTFIVWDVSNLLWPDVWKLYFAKTDSFAEAEMVCYGLTMALLYGWGWSENATVSGIQ